MPSDAPVYESLLSHTPKINQQLARYGVKFGLYKNGEFNERLFPFDAIPRVIKKDVWATLERGLAQRVDALNAYLADVYGAKQIIRDGVVPEDFAFASSGYLPQCEGIVPPGGIHSHISGIDLVEGEGDYGERLCRVLDNVNTGGLNVVLTPGRYNSAYFEHTYLAEKAGAVLAEPQELFVEDERLYYRGGAGKQLVGAVYRRLSDEFLDPLCFRADSLIGVPNLMSAYRAGNVAVLNAPGNGAADDKGIYYFVPRMVEYYLNEKPILKNAPTYLPFYPDDMAYVQDHADSLVIKDVAEAGGYGVVFGSGLTEQKLEDLKALIRREPRRFIAQEVVDFLCLPTYIDGEIAPRKADLRAFVLSGARTEVWPSGLTRYSREEGSAIVNSSQGGGFKDTWVLS